MNKTFFVSRANELSDSAGVYDIHNEFDFVELRVNPDAHTVGLLFKRCYGEGIPQLWVRFLGVDHLSISAGLVHVIDVDEIGYKNHADFNHDWLIPEEKAAPSDHMVFRFSGDEYVRVHATSAMLDK